MVCDDIGVHEANHHDTILSIYAFCSGVNDLMISANNCALWILISESNSYKSAEYSITASLLNHAVPVGMSPANCLLNACIKGKRSYPYWLTSSPWAFANATILAFCSSFKIYKTLFAELVTKSVLCPIPSFVTSRRYWNPKKSATFPGGKKESEQRLPAKKPSPSNDNVLNCAWSEIACSIL